MPLLMYSAKERRLRTVCGQGVAPAAATIGRFRELGLDMVPGTGLLAACVPGAFDAWLTMLRDYGTLPLEAVLTPAIDFAGDGYPLIDHTFNTIASVRDLFLTEWPSSPAVSLRAGDVPAAGPPFPNHSEERRAGKGVSRP